MKRKEIRATPDREARRQHPGYRAGCSDCGFAEGLLVPHDALADHECPASDDVEDCGRGEDEAFGEHLAGGDSSVPAPSLFDELRGRLQERVVGHQQAVDRLALAGLQHLMGSAGQRLLLIGPTGVGKSTLCRALADALSLPHVTVDVGELAETNWSGLNLTDVLYTLRQRADGDERRMRRAVVVLDEIDKAAHRDFEGSGEQYRRGKQQSLLGLLGGGMDIHYGPDRNTPRWTWRSNRALVLAAGVFEGVESQKPTPDDLIRWGMLPEFVGRLGSMIRLQPLEPEQLEEVLWRELQEVGARYEAFGYRLLLAPSALGEVAERVAERKQGLNPRSGATLLRDAAERALTRLLDSGAPRGSQYELQPGDVQLPDSDEDGAGIGFRS